MTARVFRLLAAAGLMSFGWAAPTERALAHASPHVLDIVFRPTGDVLVSNRGLIFGEADRSTWRLLCTEVFDISTSEEPSVVSTADGRLLVATSRGLSSSADEGCSWQGLAPFAQTSVPALAVDPSSPARLYLAAYTPEPSDLGGLYRSEDGGANWQKLRAADERDYLRSIRVAPSDPLRVYATGQSWDDSGAYSYYLIRSNDGGRTWERTTFELEDGEREVELLAISPRDPAVLALRVATNAPATKPERLLISRDGGASHVSPLRRTLLSALAFSADGMQAWVAAQEGLFESTDGLATFSRVGAAESLSYVAERDGALFAGGYYAGLAGGGNGVGVTRALADGFSAYMELTHVRAPVACPADSPSALRCERWWGDWERELMLGQFSPDAGLAADGGGSVDASAGRDAVAAAPEAGRGCSVGAARGGGTRAAVLLLAAAALGLRVRRSRRAHAT